MGMKQTNRINRNQMAYSIEQPCNRYSVHMCTCVRGFICATECIFKHEHLFLDRIHKKERHSRTLALQNSIVFDHFCLYIISYCVYMCTSNSSILCMVNVHPKSVCGKTQRIHRKEGMGIWV